MSKKKKTQAPEAPPVDKKAAKRRIKLEAIVASKKSSKKERKAAEAELAAIVQAEAETVIDAGKKGKGHKAAAASADHAARVAEAKKVLKSKNSSKKERKAAQRFLDEEAETPGDGVGNGSADAPAKSAPADDADPLAPSPLEGLTDAQLKARVKAKAAARAALKAEGKTEADIQHEHLAKNGHAEDVEKLVNGSKAEKTKGKKKAKAADEEAEETAEASELTAPTEVVERDHWGRPIITYENAAGEVKTKGYTRMTTYIDCLEDKTNLEKWKVRTALQGAGLDLERYIEDGELDLSDSLIAKVTKVARAHDKAIAKIEKRGKKGELDLGQFALLRAEADQAWKTETWNLASEALELGGAHDQAQKGTDLHGITEAYDRSGLKLDKFLETEEGQKLTPVDVADLTAYAEKMIELGIEHIAIEEFVVIDELSVGGTLDRLSLVKLPGTSRRTRLVADIKTGRIDYSPGKIAMQVRGYATGKKYDHANPLERVDLKASKSKGLLIHLPQGEGRCDVYVIDLDIAAEGLRLARDVREWRSTGKKAYNVKTPLTPDE